jgi:DNA mismatch repair protein MSH5
MSAVESRANQLRSLLTTPSDAVDNDTDIDIDIDVDGENHDLGRTNNIAAYNAARIAKRKRALTAKRDERAESDTTNTTTNATDTADNNIDEDIGGAGAPVRALCAMRAGERVGLVHYDGARNAFLFVDQQLTNDGHIDVRSVLALVHFRLLGGDPLRAVVTSSGGGEQFAFNAELQRAFAGAELVVIAPSNFNQKSGLRRLELLADKSTLYLAAHIDIENSLLMRCFDGLCHLLQKKLQLPLFSDAAAATNAPRRVASFDHVSLDALMHMNHNTFVALQIVSPAGAVGAVDGGAGAQRRSPLTAPIDSIEALMLAHTTSPGGKALMRRWVRAPLLQLDVIVARQRMVQWFVAPAQLGVVAQLKALLGSLKAVAALVQRLASASRPAKLSDIVSVRNAAATLVELLQLCRATTVDKRQLFAGLDAIDCTQLLTLIAVVDRVVDTSASKDDGERFAVRDGIDKELDDLRFFYLGLGDFFDSVGVEELDALAPKLPGVQSLAIAYYPQLGTQLVIGKGDVHDLVRALTAAATPVGAAAAAAAVAAAPPYEILLNYGLEFQFETSDNAFFKNERMLELDEFLGDIHSDIKDLENAIVRQLEAACVEHAPTLLAALDVAAIVDCALAFAGVAQAQKYACPTVTDEPGGSLYVLNGRHPLLECQARGAFVPNNTAIDASSKVQLLTGPNFSGKSVYLKQNALICYMAQIGSFVPADGAQLSLIDAIHTRLYSNDSASSTSPLSSWALDCQQVSAMLRQATPRSLLLVDEFGKGTAVRDGVAMLAALLRHLAARADAPKVFVTTHHAELYSRGLLSDSVLREHVQHTHMQFAVAPGADDGAIVLLYKVVATDVNHVPQSFGLECARRAGMPAAVLSRARSVLDDVANDRAIEPLREPSVESQARAAQHAHVLARFKQLLAGAVTDDAIAAFAAEIKALAE